MISVQLFCFKGGFVCAVSLYQTDLGLGYFVWLFVVVVFWGGGGHRNYSTFAMICLSDCLSLCRRLV